MAVTDSIRYYLINQLYLWRSFMAYRAQALLWLVYSTFSGIFSLITMTVIYSVSSGFAGWSYYQMLILSATMVMVINATTYSINGWQIVSAMRQGRLDMHMVRPYGLATVMLSAQGVKTDIAGFASGVAIFAYAAWELHLSIIYMLFFLGVATVGTYALLLFELMITVLSYHLFRSGTFINQLVGALTTVGSYPLSVFGPIIMLLFTVVVPIGIATYYPAEMIFGKINVTLSIAVVAFSLVVAAVSYKLFYLLMRYYTSGGG